MGEFGHGKEAELTCERDGLLAECKRLRESIERLETKERDANTRRAVAQLENERLCKVVDAFRCYCASQDNYVRQTGHASFDWWSREDLERTRRALEAYDAAKGKP